tara:strand:- start:810 stop:1073 length:264 start_codon:yes stop_codon:yes gene_type:complete
MPKEREYKKGASKETIRQRKKNQSPTHKRKRVESAKMRRDAGLKPLKGNAGNPAKRSEADHKQKKMVSHKTNRSQDNNKNHKRTRKA